MRCARDDDGDGTMSTQVPARKASAEVKGCLHRLLQLEHNPGVHGGRDSDVDGTHPDEGPGNTRTEKRTLFPVPWHLPIYLLPMWQVL